MLKAQKQALTKIDARLPIHISPIGLSLGVLKRVSEALGVDAWRKPARNWWAISRASMAIGTTLFCPMTAILYSLLMRKPLCSAMLLAHSGGRTCSTYKLCRHLPQPYLGPGCRGTFPFVSSSRAPLDPPESLYAQSHRSNSNLPLRRCTYHPHGKLYRNRPRDVSMEDTHTPGYHVIRRCAQLLHI
jgi:hypothetical protein